MDYAFQFENLANEHLGRPIRVTYATYWSNKIKRTSLLFTLCLKMYDKNSNTEIGNKLSFFMEEIFKDEDNSKMVSIECLDFLNSLSQIKSK